MFKRVLIANRGLIQANCVRAVKELGATAITIFEEEDRDSAGVRNADEAYELKVNDPAIRPYLDIEQIVELASALKVDAVHPGYGFLAQNTRFAEALQQRGIALVAPRANGAFNLSNKHFVRGAAARAGLNVLPGSEAFLDRAWLQRSAVAIKYPLVLKAVHGYGGIGMRVVHGPDELDAAFDAVQAACAKFSLNSAEVFLEEYLPDARHIEFPVLRDELGRTIVFPELECSLQRRFQKLLVETPAPNLDPDLRLRLQSEIRVLCERLGVTGFASVEFLIRDGKPWFLEINGYIQPSHTATTLLSGVDLLKKQIRLLSGESLELGDTPMLVGGHVIGAYIFAEDPENNYEPSPGMVDRLYLPFGEEVFMQTSIFSGARISPFYDPMVAKLLVRARDRKEAVLKLKIALEEFFVEGVRTNIPLMRGVAASTEFAQACLTPALIADAPSRQRLIESLKSERDHEIAALVAALALHRDGESLKRLEDSIGERGATAVLGAATRWLKKSRKPRPQL